MKKVMPGNREKQYVKTANCRTVEALFRVSSLGMLFLSILNRSSRLAQCSLFELPYHLASVLDILICIRQPGLALFTVQSWKKKNHNTNPPSPQPAQWGFPGGASGKEPACQCRRSGRSPGGGHGNPLQFS